MHVTVTGRNVDVPSELRQRASAELGAVDRLLGGRRTAHRTMEIVFSASRNPRVAAPISCDVTVRDRGATIHVTGSGSDLAAAVDAARTKLGRKARTYKGKRRRRVGASHRGDVTDPRVPVAM